jgi:RsiW-degrading membrane proteinase PrsW (M82 family)
VSAILLALGVLPVLSFLLALVLLDSYKLVRLRWVALLLAAGCGVALACMYLNPWLKSLLGVSIEDFARYEAPILEELLKGAVIAMVIARRRIGFLVDAAICGFAIGAGFAAVENLHYFLVLERPTLLVWTIRGFGTAIMHGGATAILAVTSKHLTDRFDSVRPDRFLPGLVLAAGIHSLFNHFYVSPVLSTLGLIVLLPLIFMLVFKVSEDATHEWLGVGFDSDQELLEAINRGVVSETRVGRYLRSLRERLPAETVFDMLCLIRLQLELSIRAKGELLMRKAGFEVRPDPEVGERLKELEHLEKNIGKTGLLALQPIFNMSSRDLWQVHMLKRK